MTLLKWLIVVAAVFGGVVALAYFAQRSLMYYPDRLRTPPAMAGLFDAQEVVLDTADGEKVIVWHVPAKQDKPLILYFHGNAGSLRDIHQRDEPAERRRGRDEVFQKRHDERDPAISRHGRRQAGRMNARPPLTSP